MSMPSQSAERLMQTLGLLPDVCRQAVGLKVLDGWSLAAVAHALQRSESDVVCLLRHAFAVLHESQACDSRTDTWTIETLLATPIDEILAEHLRAVDSGRTPDPADLLARHPTISDELAVFLARMDRLATLAGSLRDGWSSQITADQRAADATDEVPRTVGPNFGIEIPGYQILDILGRGGMAIVYKAHHRGLKRDVAVKMIRNSQATRPVLARFRAEAQAIARLQHPNIVQVFEIGENHGEPFCALELVSGGTLADLLANRPQEPLWAAEMARTLTLAVQYAHEQGIVHRDLKPANVLLTGKGSPKVVDFGLAKFLDDDPGLTRAGAIMGTPSYMAPEQAEGQIAQIGPATDVWALGAILYEMLTGRPPFKSESIPGTLEMVRSQEPVPVRALNRAVPRDLATIVSRCLEKNPKHRYASAQILADRLGLFLAGEPIPDRPRSWLNRSARFLRKHRLESIAVVLIAVSLGVLVAVLSLPTPEPLFVEPSRIEPEAADPDQPRKDAARVLADGLPFRFEGHEPLPGPFRQVYGNPAIPTRPADAKYFTLGTHAMGLWELLPDPMCDEYEFSAEVRHEAANGDSKVGLYFGFRQVPTGLGGSPRGAFFTASYADRGLHVTRGANGAWQSVFLTQIRLFETEPKLLAPHGLLFRQPFRAASILDEAPWRVLRLTIAPTGARLAWEPTRGRLEQLRTFPVPQLTEAISVSARGMQHFLEVPTDWRTRSGFGLFVSQGQAAFRNIIVKPRPRG